MRTHVLNAMAGALGIATVVSSAPAISYGQVDTCVDPATVFITLPASTVYVTVDPGLENPTITEYSTIHSTLYLTNPAHTHTQIVDPGTVVDPGTAVGAGADTTSYVATITQTAVVTVTQVSLTATPSGASLTYSETAAPGGLFNFVVENGTTYWLGGQTPAPSESFVLLTSAITVYPVEETTDLTLTIHSTVHSTSHVTLTQSLPVPTSTAAGSGFVYSGMASGGWNMTSTATAKGVTGSGAVISDPTGTISHPIFTIPTSFDIYHTSDSTISLTSYAAQSGFSSHPTAASSADGAVMSGISATSFTEKSTTYSVAPPPYANSTAMVSATSSAGGIVPSGVAQPTGYSTSVSVSPSSAPTLVPLGKPCVPGTSQCENEADCYAVNSMLQPVCGNFQSTCTSNAQCAFNTCVSGFCSGPKSGQSTAAPATSSSSVNTTNTVPSYYSYVFPTHSNNGVSTSASSSSVSSSVLSSSSVLTTSYVAPTPIQSQNSTIVATSTSSSASALPTKCGEQGDFVLDFDDIPPLSISDPKNSTVQPAPIFNPYHQFDFSDGFTFGPPPKEAYLPSSPPLLVEFRPFFNSDGSNPNAGPNAVEQGYNGQISDGDHELTGCFHFNFRGASLGCNSTGPPCIFTLSGWSYNPRTEVETPLVITTRTVPSCPPQENCTLTPITVPTTFTDLTHIKINATVGDVPTNWWMDDLMLGWTDNSCAMGLCRINTHLHR